MVFRSPKYYAELRKFRKEQELRKLRNNSDQAISDEASTEATSVRPGPGLKLQATSNKPQAPSSLNNEPQASSPKQNGSSFTPDASSAKIPEPGNN